VKGWAQLQTRKKKKCFVLPPWNGGTKSLHKPVRHIISADKNIINKYGKLFFQKMLHGRRLPIGFNSGAAL
jgi:hypothetical protein